LSSKTYIHGIEFVLHACLELDILCAELVHLFGDLFDLLLTQLHHLGHLLVLFHGQVDLIDCVKHLIVVLDSEFVLIGAIFLD
jgi:hypothetical protein